MNWSARGCFSFSRGDAGARRKAKLQPVRDAARQLIVAVPLAVELEQGVAVGGERLHVGGAFAVEEARDGVEDVIEISFRVLVADLVERRAVDRELGRPSVRQLDAFVAFVADLL